jgi:hypothetical protein
LLKVKLLLPEHAHGCPLTLDLPFIPRFILKKRAKKSNYGTEQKKVGLGATIRTANIYMRHDHKKGAHAGTSDAIFTIGVRQTTNAIMQMCLFERFADRSLTFQLSADCHNHAFKSMALVLVSP